MFRLFLLHLGVCYDKHAVLEIRGKSLVSENSREILAKKCRPEKEREHREKDTARGCSILYRCITRQLCARVHSKGVCTSGELKGGRVTKLQRVWRELIFDRKNKKYLGLN